MTTPAETADERRRRGHNDGLRTLLLATLASLAWGGLTIVVERIAWGLRLADRWRNEFLYDEIGTIRDGGELLAALLVVAAIAQFARSGGSPRPRSLGLLTVIVGVGALAVHAGFFVYRFGADERGAPWWLLAVLARDVLDVAFGVLLITMLRSVNVQERAWLRLLAILALVAPPILFWIKSLMPGFAAWLGVWGMLAGYLVPLGYRAMLLLLARNAWQTEP